MNILTSSRKIPTRHLVYTTVILLAAGIATVTALSLQSTPVLRTGQIEVREIDIASKIPGRVERINVREGDRVEAGHELFSLTDREVRAKVAQAEGAVHSAQAQWNMTRRGTRPEQLAMAERKLAAARSQYVLAEKTHARMRGLHTDSLISDQEFDVIGQKLEAARAAMEAAEAQCAMARTGARTEEKAMAEGQYQRAAQTLEEARSYLDESRIFSPVSGIVQKRLVDAGELVSTGYPVLTIIDTDDVWAELNLPETELQRVRKGDELKGEVHGLGETLRFRVASIAPMAEFANWRAQDDRGSFEIRSFTIKLYPIETQLHLRPGMTVLFKIPER